jgi:hypothetical protein
VFYVDESGDGQQYSIPLQSGQTPIFTLAAVALPLDQWRDFDRDYLGLKRRFFLREMSSAPGRPEHWEAKGNELVAPRNRDSRRNRIFVLELLALCESYEARFFGVTFRKNRWRRARPMSLYTMGLQRLAERFHAYLSEDDRYSSGIVVLDSRERRRLDFQVAVSYHSFVFGHDTGRTLTTLQEIPLFADSRLTAGLQITDNITALLYANHYHYYCRRLPGAPDYSHAQQYWSHLDNLQFKSQQAYSGHYLYGFYVYDFTQRWSRGQKK